MVQGKFVQTMYEFTETEKAPGYVYADEYFEPVLISWFAQSPFSVDLTGNGHEDVIIPMNRGYATGLDTSTPFVALQGGADGLSFSQALQDSMPVTNGARRASPIYIQAWDKHAYVTVAHDTGDGKGAELLVLAPGMKTDEATSALMPALPDSAGTGRQNFVDAHSLASGDLNGDGLTDLLVGQWRGDGPYALLQSPQGQFSIDRQPLFSELHGNWPMTNTQEPGVSNVLIDLHVADFTGDGLDDLVAGWGHGSTNSYLFVNRAGQFSAEDKVALPPSIYGIDNQLHLKTLVADFDGDGDLDLAILWSRDEPFYGGHYVQYLENDGTGQFVDQTESAFNMPYKDANGSFLQWSNAWQVLDVNGDGRMDIVGVSALDPSQGLVYVNLGHGRFLEHAVTGTGVRNSTIIWWGDFNLNGNLDYVAFESYWNDAAGNSSTNQFNVYEIDADFGLETRVAFKDVMIAYDIDGNAGQAYRLYKAAFDRIPDQTGLGFWIAQMDAGVSLAQAASGFVGSTEFESMYGDGVADTGFIELLYENVLDRQPDASGYAYWLDAMNNGLTREQVLAAFSESAENKVNVAGLIDQGIEYTPFIG